MQWRSCVLPWTCSCNLLACQLARAFVRERGQLQRDLQVCATESKRLKKGKTKLIKPLLFCLDPAEGGWYKKHRELKQREKAHSPASCVVQIQPTLGKKTKSKAKTIPVRSSALPSSFAFFQKIARFMLLHYSAQKLQDPHVLILTHRSHPDSPLAAALLPRPSGRARAHPGPPQLLVSVVTTRQELTSGLHGFSLIVINDF